MNYFKQEISEHIFKSKYSLEGKESVEQMWDRVAHTIAQAEKTEEDKKMWERDFREILDDFKFIPGGRILSNAGTKWRNATLSNCFVQPPVPDHFEGIFRSLNEAALTLRAGGGVGIDFSQLRPQGAKVYASGGISSGPISFMEVFNSACRSIQAGNRRGAMIAILDVGHYDIDKFIVCKQGTDYLSMFNISVMVTDEFIQHVKDDMNWVLEYKDMPRKVFRAKELWERILENTYKYNEPGVLFKDTIVRMNNLYYVEEDRMCVNPCGEQPLGSDHGTCLLGSINLTKFVKNEFTKEAEFDIDKFQQVVEKAVRFLDNVIDVNKFPLPQQKEKALNTRRIGLGVTGYADMLAMLGVRYGSERALDITDLCFRYMLEAAYLTSIKLGREKGSFPNYNKEFLKSGFMKQHLHSIFECLDFNFMRNSHLLTIPPTGTTSLLANNVSSGIEPIFELEYKRKVITKHEGSNFVRKEFNVKDYAYLRYKDIEESNFEKRGAVLEDPKFVTYKDIKVEEKIEVLATIQKYIDSSISNTTNVPNDYPFEDFKRVYMMAYEKGLKGVTTYRQGTMDAVMVKEEKTVGEHILGSEWKELEKNEQAVVEHLLGTPARPSEFQGVQKEEKVLERKEIKKRPRALESTTYKQKIGDLAYYITIGDIWDEKIGGMKPFEIFISSTHYNPDAVAVSLLLSAQFRRSEGYEDYDFMIHNLRKIEGVGCVGWYARGEKRVTVRSLYQAISFILEERISSLKEREKVVEGDVGREQDCNKDLELDIRVENVFEKRCPVCGCNSYKRIGGCWSCGMCEYSSCE
jgi:ribonucleoside-diphosphate reductase alpha chain